MLAECGVPRTPRLELAAVAMITPIWNWLNAHPERWVPLVGAIASLAAHAIKKRWPATERIVDALVHLIPNLPAAYRAIRGEPSSSSAAKEGEDRQ